MSVPSLFDGSNFKEISKSSTLQTPSKFNAKKVHPRLIGRSVIAMALKLVLKSIICNWIECSVGKLTVIICHRAQRLLSNSQELMRTKRSDRITFFATVIDYANRDETCFTNQLTIPANG